jgi:hypothetical protein
MKYNVKLVGKNGWVSSPVKQKVEGKVVDVFSEKMAKKIAFDLSKETRGQALSDYQVFKIKN